MITVKNLYKLFDESVVLNNISTRFENGKTNLIIGQSGSGKTIFIKCILGLYGINSGEIFFGDKSFQKMNIKERSILRQEIGMVFQGSALFDSMTVEENIMFPMRMLTKKGFNEMQDRANEVIARVDLINSNKKLPSEISGGMQKRVAIGRAIVMNPKYLFCDEPNSGLDPKTSTIIDNLIQEITKEYKITTIINTHDMNSVMEIGENVLFMENGNKGWEGSNKEVFSTENQTVSNFIYSSNLFKKVRKVYQDEKKN
jgi:phospholipid/cholesterol/gamma-HCH transport system ATP-binding protein